MKRPPRKTTQQLADEDLAYTMSDKRTTDLAEAQRLVETATVDEKFEAIRTTLEALEEILMISAPDSFRETIRSTLTTLNKETRHD